LSPVLALPQCTPRHWLRAPPSNGVLYDAAGSYSTAPTNHGRLAPTSLHVTIRCKKTVQRDDAAQVVDNRTSQYELAVEDGRLTQPERAACIGLPGPVVRQRPSRTTNQHHHHHRQAGFTGTAFASKRETVLSNFAVTSGQLPPANCPDAVRCALATAAAKR